MRTRQIGLAPGRGRQDDVGVFGQIVRIGFLLDEHHAALVHALHEAGDDGVALKTFDLSGVPAHELVDLLAERLAAAIEVIHVWLTIQAMRSLPLIAHWSKLSGILSVVSLPVAGSLKTVGDFAIG